jgi:hypothetical protein
MWSLHRRLRSLVVDAMGGPVEDTDCLNLEETPALYSAKLCSSSWFALSWAVAPQVPAF